MAKKLARALSDQEQGLTFDAGKMTLEECLERWLVDSVRGTVWPSTFECYERIVDIHVNPALGRVGLKDLTSTHVRGFIVEPDVAVAALFSGAYRSEPGERVDVVFCGAYTVPSSPLS